MKVAIVSKALLHASYRHKLVELARLGVHVTAIVPEQWREGSREQRLELSTGTDVRTVETAIRWSGHFHMHYYPQLARVLRDTGADVVHIDEEPYNFATYMGIRAATRMGAATVFFTWQNISRRLPLPFRLLEREVYRTAQGALAGTQEACDVLRHKGFAKTVTIVPQFGVDPETFSPGQAPSGEFTVGFFNRCIEAKGLFITLDALGALPDDIRLSIAGDGALDRTLSDRIAQRNLKSRVELRDRIPSAAMPDLLRSVHVVVLPSLTTPRWKEQFGRVLIEAMACGIPVIGSDSGEIPYVIGDAGLVVPEGNSDALAAAIRTLYVDDALRDKLGQTGRERVLACYSNAKVAADSLEAYRGAYSSLRS